MTAIYSRDQQGIIEFHGEQRISKSAKLEQVYGGLPSRFVPDPEIEDVQGWPHAQIEWHKNLGFGVKA